MINHTTRWRPLYLTSNQLCEMLHDSVLQVEYVFQNGEVKLPLTSSKFLRGKELDFLPDNATTPYCLQIRGIESMRFSCGKYQTLRVSHFEQTPTSLRIGGRDGEFNFSGANLALTFLMDTKSIYAHIMEWRVNPFRASF